MFKPGQDVAGEEVGLGGVRVARQDERLDAHGWVPPQAAEASADASKALLACAVTATGVRSNLQSLTAEGLRPLLAIVVATLVALAMATGAAALLVR